MKIRLSNVGVIKSADLEFIPGLNLIVGSSGSGKSTLMRTIYNTATNEFADSDITFGKNSMSVEIECDGNNIQYSRSIKSKDDKCSYTVNGEKYVKIGRTALPQVSDALKIGDIEINGDKINFNFNLQFSSPFLILGSQSTLYNVLTYRSSFDISSINDYYNIDVKTNNSEINTNVKLREKLTQNLEELECHAESLSQIETLYSDFTNYKHKLNVLEELKSLSAKSEAIIDLDKRIENTTKLLLGINSASYTLTKLKELSEIKSKISYNKTICDKATMISNSVDSHKRALDAVSKLLDLNSLEIVSDKLKLVKSNYKVLSKLLTSKVMTPSIEMFINDVAKQKLMLMSKNKYSLIIAKLGEANNGVINQLGELHVTSEKLEALAKVHDDISNVDKNIKAIASELDKFEVCPLCGSRLERGECINNG